MIEIVCEFVVKQEARGQFELAYGPGGVWSKLFAKSGGYRGTTLLRDTKKSLSRAPRVAPQTGLCGALRGEGS